jgi:hypothetical protein
MHRDFFDAALEGGNGGGKVTHARIVSRLPGGRQQNSGVLLRGSYLLEVVSVLQERHIVMARQLIVQWHCLIFPLVWRR